MNQLANAHKYLVASEQLKLVGVMSQEMSVTKCCLCCGCLQWQAIQLHAQSVA